MEDADFLVLKQMLNYYSGMVTNIERNEDIINVCLGSDDDAKLDAINTFRQAVIIPALLTQQTQLTQALSTMGDKLNIEQTAVSTRSPPIRVRP